MAGNKTFTELTELETVDKSADWMAVVDVSDTSASVYGTTKKAVVDQFIGEKGDAATVDVGTTTTGEPGTNANVENVGTTSAAILDFTIPRGDKGEKGDKGDKGDKGNTGEAGMAATVDAGTTTTLDAGQNASVVNSGSTSAAIFDFYIPKGEKGDRGERGIQGPQGIAGENGEDAYVYIAYASDDSGTGFTTTFNPSLDYIAIKSTTTPIPSPTASDFTGLWKKYKGEKGDTGDDGESAYVYIAYASDTNGTGFTTTFSPTLNYIAIKSTNTEIVSPQASDFTGLWFNYKGEKGDQGPQGEKGDAATVNVGTTTTGLPGTSASVVNSGSTSAAILDFTIPRGDKGEQGPQGPQGEPGEPGEDGLDITWRGTYSASTSYVVNDAVYYNGGSYICIQNTTGNLPTNETYWNLMAAQGAPGEGSGDVTGPDSATDNAIARFDLATGKLIQNSLATVSDSGSINIPAGQQYLVGGSPVEGYSDEQAQDAVGSILTDSTEIDFTYNDTTPSITASIKAGSIDETKLDTSVNASLDLADSAIQSTDLATVATTGSYSDLSGTPDLTTKLDKKPNVTAINDTGIADGEIAVFNLTNKDIRTSDKTITTSLGADDTTVPTSKAVKDVTDTKITAFADPNADRIVFWDDSAGAFAALTASTGLTLSGTTLTVRAASDTLTGIVERATDTEFTTGTDTTRYVTANQIANVAQNMGNKTLTSPVINTGVSGTAILDEDNMASNSATKLATQQSIKAYADTKIAKAPNITSIDDTGIADGEVAIFDLTNKKIKTSDKTLPTGAIVGTTDTQTLSGKTLTSPVINTGVSGTAILDEDNMASNSATKLATQQSIKAYVDSKGYTWKGEWVTATVYAVNDTVEYGGSGYICVVAHTSGTFSTDLSAGKWEMFVEGVSADSIASTIHGATAKTTPVDADEVGLIDSAASNVLKKLTWSNIKATLKSYFDSVTTTLTNKTLSSPLFTGTIDGWISAGETWTYASADDPTFTFTISGDKTSKYSAGMRIKLTQTSVKYFIITAVSYSSPNTTITVYGGTDYDLVNATITSPYYSTQKAPQGFPLNPNKWSVTLVNNTNPEGTISQNVWTNLDSLSISIPIGCWSVYFSVYGLYSYRNGTSSSPMVTLSTANNSETDKEFTIRFESTGATATLLAVAGTASRTKELLIATKTSYYINFTQVGADSASVGCQQRIIRATCAYL